MIPALLRFSNPRVRADTLPRLPPGMTTQTGISPIKPLANFQGDRLLAFNSQAVFGVCQVDSLFHTKFLDVFHTAIEICVDGEDASAVCEGLDQLSRTDFTGWKKDEGSDAGRSAVGRKRG